MYKIHNLEIHATHSCNLFCQQCSHYSNFSMAGTLTEQDFIDQVSPWSTKLQPSRFSILGGEPLLNPAIEDIIRQSRRLWPNSILQLVTNGFLLHKYPNLGKVLFDNKCNLEISVHHESPEYENKLVKTRKTVSGWITDGISVNWRPSSASWRKVYKVEDGKILPYDDQDQRKSWEICRSKYCPQIFHGLLWKCPQIAYLGMLDDRIGGLDEQWGPYLKYAPLSPDASDVEVSAFLSKQDESCCKMCPANFESFELENPMFKDDLRKSLNN